MTWQITGVPRKSTESMTQGEKIIKQMTNSEKRWQEPVVRGGPSGNGIENYELRHPGVANTSDASSWNNTHFRAFWLHREIQHCHFGIPTARNKSTHPIPYSIDFLFPNWLLGKGFLCHPETAIYIYESWSCSDFLCKWSVSLGRIIYDMPSDKTFIARRQNMADHFCPTILP